MIHSYVARRQRRSTFSPPLDAYCPMCGRRCLVMLPPRLVAIQPDATNAVCLHLIGGCDQGYAIDVEVLRSFLAGDMFEDTIRTEEIIE